MDVLPGFEALQALARMKLRRRCDDGRLDSWLRQTLAEVRRPMRDSARLRHIPRGVRAASAKADHLDAGNFRDGVEMLLSERALANHRNFHLGRSFSNVSRSAVFQDDETRSGIGRWHV